MSPRRRRTPARQLAFSHHTVRFLLLASCTLLFGGGPQSRAAKSTAAVAAEPLSPFGVASSAEASRSYRAFLPSLQRAGAKTLRLFGSWALVEPEDGRFDFSVDDARVALAAAHGITITGLLNHSAAWALPKGVHNVKTMPVKRLKAWSDYVRHAVKRYRGKIGYWEVWNEPNTAGFNAGHHSPAAYAALVRASCEAAKSVNPASHIAITTANYDVRFLSLVVQELVAAGKSSCIDVIAVHPYELLGAMTSPNGEAMYLGIVGNLRKMLAEHAPDRVDVPIWFTEVGKPVDGPRAGSPASQAQAADLLIKTYVLGLAQGVAQIQWFEVKDAGGSQRHGLLDDDLSPRTSYSAYRALTQALGPHPKYEGFVALGTSGSGYGLVFRAGDSHVLAAWMPAGQTAKIVLPPGARAVDIYSGAVAAVPPKKPYTLTAKPVLLVAPGGDFVAKARANRDKPFPWGFGKPTTGLAELNLGEPQTGQPKTGRGLRQVTGRPARHVFADGSAGVKVGQQNGNRLLFAVDPAFADYNTHDVYIRVTARTLGPNRPGANTGMNLFYQPRTADPHKAPEYPYRSLRQWYTVPDDGHWHTHTWHLTDAMFVNTFGYGFYLQVDRSAPFVIGRVAVSKTAFADADHSRSSPQ